MKAPVKLRKAKPSKKSIKKPEKVRSKQTK